MRILSLICVTAKPGLACAETTLAHLPNTGISAAKADSSGNYFAVRIDLGDETLRGTTQESSLKRTGSNRAAAARIVPGAAMPHDAATNTLLTWTGTDLIRFDPSAPPPAIGCILDAADLPVASFPPSVDGLSVGFSGTAAPRLYISPQQINVQAPYEIANAQTANLVLTSSQLGISESRNLPVVQANPVVFLDTAATAASLGLNACSRSGSFFGGGPFTIPLAFNSDDSRNGCANPAIRSVDIAPQTRLPVRDLNFTIWIR